MKLIHTLVFLPIFTTLILIAASAQAESLYLSICASMTDTYRELESNFTAVHPDIELFSNIGPSGSLAKQIEQGAPADIFISANPDWMNYLLAKNLVDDSSETILARNRLVFVGPRDAPCSGPEDLRRLKRIAIGNPVSVPAGQYAHQALKKLGLYDELKNGKKLVMAKDVRQALIYADRGEVDGAFVYLTDARLSRQTIVHFQVDPSLHSPITYPLCLTKSGSRKTSARLFYDYLRSAEALKIMNRHGFENPL